jgi:hypothetical protein
MERSSPPPGAKTTSVGVPAANATPPGRRTSSRAATHATTRLSTAPDQGWVAGEITSGPSSFHTGATFLDLRREDAVDEEAQFAAVVLDLDDRPAVVLERERERLDGDPSPAAGLVTLVLRLGRDPRAHGTRLGRLEARALAEREDGAPSAQSPPSPPSADAARRAA